MDGWQVPAARAAGYGASGALAGAPFGPLGALVGGGAGLAAGGVQALIENSRKKKAAAATGTGELGGDRKGSFWSGYSDYTKQLPILSPEQITAMNALLPGTVEQLRGQQFDFSPIEEKSRRDFQRYTEPGLANRFAAFGGGTSTDAYRQALASARSEHELGLAGLKSEYGLKQQTQALNLLNTLLQPQYQNLYFPSTPGFGQSFAANALPQLASSALQHGIPAIADWASRRQATAQQPVPTMPTAPQSAAPTIAQAATPQGQAVQQLAQAAAPTPQLGGAGTTRGISPLGRGALGLGAGAAGVALTNLLVNQMRGGQ